jgi:hypothetical protein
MFDTRILFEEILGFPVWVETIPLSLALLTSTITG